MGKEDGVTKTKFVNVLKDTLESSALRPFVTQFVSMEGLVRLLENVLVLMDIKDLTVKEVFVEKSVSMVENVSKRILAIAVKDIMALDVKSLDVSLDVKIEANAWETIDVVAVVHSMDRSVNTSNLLIEGQLLPILLDDAEGRRKRSLSNLTICTVVTIFSKLLSFTQSVLYNKRYLRELPSQ